MFLKNEIKTKNEMKMNVIGEYKGYRIYGCRDKEYVEAYMAGDLMHDVVYCITDKNEVLVLDGAIVGQANLNSGRIIDFNPSRRSKVYYINQREPEKKAVASSESDSVSLGGAFEFNVFDLNKFLKENTVDISPVEVDFKVETSF